MRGQSDMTGSGCGRIRLSSFSRLGQGRLGMLAPSIGGAVIFETNRKLKSKNFVTLTQSVDFVYNRPDSSARLGFRSLTTEIIDLREQEDVSVLIRKIKVISGGIECNIHWWKCLNKSTHLNQQSNTERFENK